MLNKTQLIGSLGRDPEVRYTGSGACVVNVSLATTEKWRDKQTHQQQERTEWHKLVFFGKPAEVARDYLRKGMLVYVEGKNRTRKWQDQQNQDHYTTEIEVSEMKMLSSSRGSTDEVGVAANRSPVNVSNDDFGGLGAAPFGADIDNF